MRQEIKTKNEGRICCINCLKDRKNKQKNDEQKIESLVICMVVLIV